MRKVKRVLGGGSRFSAILAADLHLRDDAPECREPVEYHAAQWTKMDFIRRLCELNECPLFVAGDLFDYWKPSPGLITRTLHALPELTIAAVK